MNKFVSSSRNLDFISSLDADRFRKYCNFFEAAGSKLKILVFGDFMLDYFMRCSLAGTRTTNRHDFGCDYDLIYDTKLDTATPENYLLGGAARIALIISSFAQVSMLGIIGDDCQGNKLNQIAQENNIKTFLTEVKNYFTITKYYIDNIKYGEKKPDDLYENIKAFRINRELSKFDVEKLITKENEREIIENLVFSINDVDCIIFKDNEKGLFSKDFLLKIIPIVNKKREERSRSSSQLRVFLDPKYDWDKFKELEIDGILPNIKETAAGIYKDWKYVMEYVKRDVNKKLEMSDFNTLINKYDKIADYIIKSDKEGAKIIQQINNKNLEYDLATIEPYLCHSSQNGNEIGCGDIFDSYYICLFLLKDQISACYKIGIKNEECLRFANFVAGIQYKKGPHMVAQLDDIYTELDHLEPVSKRHPQIVRITVGDKRKRKYKNPIKIGLAQLEYDLDSAQHSFDYTLVSPDKQFKKISAAIEMAKFEKIDMLCFPELSFTEDIINQVLKQLINTDIFIIGGSYYKNRKNICTIIHNGRKLAEYVKINPTILENCPYEDMGVQEGNEIFIFDTRFGIFSVLTCSDYQINLKYLKNLNESTPVNFVINPCFDHKKDNLMKSITVAEGTSIEYKTHTVFINRAENIAKQYGCSGIVGITHRDYQNNPILLEEAINRAYTNSETPRNPLLGEIGGERIIVGDFHWNISGVYSNDASQPALFRKIKYYKYNESSEIWDS